MYVPLNYVRMADCKEVQDFKKLRLTRYNSRTVRDEQDGWITTRFESTSYALFERNEKYFKELYLPTQNDIQKKLFMDHLWSLSDLVSHFNSFVNPPVSKLLNLDLEKGRVINEDYVTIFMKQYIEQFNFMEELWLAFYMFHEHKKAWRNGRWEKVKEK